MVETSERTSGHRPSRPWTRAAVVAAAVVATLALLEGGLRLKQVLAARQLADRLPPPVHVRCGDCPHVYGLNPAHPEINERGLRDRDIAVPKPSGHFRILVLGDSVTYGVGVRRERTFCKLLEQSFEADGRKVEVVNAGVSGYTPYNELEAYEVSWRDLDADMAVVAFCLNDVADPLLHWSYTDPIHSLPPEAIPNPAYHRDHIQPIADALNARNRRWSRKSELYCFLSERFGWDVVESPNEALRFAQVDGRRWPVYVTGEDTIGIGVLMDYDSTEWRWLRKTYDELLAAVRRDEARMAVMALPLAYQLDPEYPFLPQALLGRYCTERGIPFFDALPELRASRDKAVFPAPHSGFEDIWHLTPEGHACVARSMRRWLDESGLVP